MEKPFLASLITINMQKKYLVFMSRRQVPRTAADQTWTLVREQCDRALSSKAWKVEMSSRGTVEGSGRSRAAEKEALAMASW